MACSTKCNALYILYLLTIACLVLVVSNKTQSRYKFVYSMNFVHFGNKSSFSEISPFLLIPLSSCHCFYSDFAMLVVAVSVLWCLCNVSSFCSCFCGVFAMLVVAAPVFIVALQC